MRIATLRVATLRAATLRAATLLSASLLMASPLAAARPAGPAIVPAAHTLRVCADPNNMPFSDRAKEGFENRIASLLARDLGETPVYTWWAQRRGFIRTTLAARQCDVVVGITAGAANVLTTPAYYRSTYVFVTRRDRHLDISSFDDPRLRTLRVGLHVIGADYNSLPPGVALAARGIVHNVVGYSIYGNYAKPSPPSALIAAVAKGDVDVAIAWGPLAGYYAKRSPVPLVLTPVATPTAGHGIPFAYDIAIGVRRDDRVLADKLAGVLVRRHTEVERILRDYGVPLAVGSAATAPAGSHPSAARLGVGLSCISINEERRCA
jgi:quinoprotein dehydrogenase-associated probable ABC transporter substrate-binding protein